MNVAAHYIKWNTLIDAQYVFRGRNCLVNDGPVIEQHIHTDYTKIDPEKVVDAVDLEDVENTPVGNDTTTTTHNNVENTPVGNDATKTTHNITDGENNVVSNEVEP